MFVSSHCFSLTPSDESKWQPLLSSLALLLLRCQQVAGVRSVDGRTDEAVFIKSAPRVGRSSFLVRRWVVSCCLQRQEGESKSHFSRCPPSPRWMDGFGPILQEPVGKGYSFDFLLLTDWQADIPEHAARKRREKLSTNISTLLTVNSKEEIFVDNFSVLCL